MPVSRLKKGGTLRRQLREPLSSVPSSSSSQPEYLKCRWISSNLTQFAHCGDGQAGLLLQQQRSALLQPRRSGYELGLSGFPTPCGSQLDFSFFVHTRYIPHELGQTHADGALISSPCSGFPFLPD